MNETDNKDVTAKAETGTETKIDTEDKKSSSEDFNYIAPAKSYKETQKIRRKHIKERKHGRHTSSRASKDYDEKSAADYVFVNPKRHKKKHKRHMKKGIKILIIVLSIILGIVIAVSGTVLILNEIGRRQMHSLDSDELDITPPETVVSDDGALDVKTSANGETITYNGHTYKINKNIATILFMGLDQDTTEADDENADAIYLMAIDTEAKTFNILSISRETMCDVDVYDSEGRFVENRNMQLCLAFGYGEDAKSRCENVVTATSRYLYNIPLSSYFAIDLTCISTLNDEVGGVTVTSNVEFTSPEDGRTISEGESVILHGEEAEYYVRTRSKTGTDANAKRMERQQQYLKSFMASVVPAAKKDISVVTDLYSTITEHSTTDLTLPKLTYMATSALSIIQGADDINFVGIKGTTTQSQHEDVLINEFRPDEKELLETILKLFYNQVD